MQNKPGKTTPVNVYQKLKDIGKRVKVHRKAVANNYEDFSTEHKINKVTLSRIENGENYKMESLLRVLNALDITLEDLLK